MSSIKTLVVIAATAALLNAMNLSAATTNVAIGDNFFSPRTVTIAINDAVRWSFVGSDEHSTTHSGTPRLWDSGVRRTGTFTNVFTAAGNYPYRCTEHSSQTGTVIVEGANTPPTVTITNPANNAVFSAPASFILRASASDAQGPVARVDFFNGITLMGIDSTSPYSWGVNDLATGTYTFSAVAWDSGGAPTSLRATNTITISVVNAQPPLITSPQRTPAGQFRFSHSANAGLRYAVESSTNLAQWRSLATNTAAASSVNVTNSASANAEFYRVRRLPNP